MKTKVCHSCKQSKPVADFSKRHRMKDGLMSSCRPCTAARKREAYARLKERPVEPTFSISKLRIPAERLSTIFEKWTDGGGMTSRLNESVQRRIWSVCNETHHVQFDTADKLLIELGLDGLWHVKPEDGGLADFYHHEDYPCERVKRTDHLGGWVLRQNRLRRNRTGGAMPPAARTPGNQHPGGGGDFEGSPEADPAAPPLGRVRTSPIRKKAA